MNENKMMRQKKINVPTNYRNASKILCEVVENKKNVKTLVLGNSHMRNDKGFAMMDKILNNLKAIDELISKTKILEEQPKLNKWLAKVLVAELIFGRGQLSGESLPVKCVLSYQDKLMEAYQSADMKPAERIKEKGPRYVRINTNALNLMGAQRLLAEEGWIMVDQNFKDYDEFLKRIQKLDDSEYVVDYHFKDLLVFPSSSRKYWAKNLEHRNKFVQQNKACLLPTYLLDPKKKGVVLDMCAAPGNKTTHMANLMKNKGRIYAVERNADRYKVLCENSTEFGVIKTINDDCLSLTDEQVPGVEYILLDPSCSGSGRMNQLNEEIDESRLYKLQGLQYKLLKHALTAFPSTTRVVYSTCSLREEENEKVVQDVLRHCPNFKLVNAGEALGMDWKNFGSSNFKGVGEKCLYARPEVDLTDGMFVAVLERCGEDEVNEVYAAHEKQKESYDNVNRMMARQGKKKDKKKAFKEEGENLNMEEESTFQKRKKDEDDVLKDDNEEVSMDSESSKALVNDANVEEASRFKEKKKNYKKSEDDEYNVESLTALESVNALEARMSSESLNGEHEDVATNKKKKKKSKNKVEPVLQDVESLKALESVDDKALLGKEKKKKKHKENKNESSNVEISFEAGQDEMSTESLKDSKNVEDQGEVSTKRKNKKRKNEENEEEASGQTTIESFKLTENGEKVFSEKKKKKKSKEKTEDSALELAETVANEDQLKKISKKSENVVDENLEEPMKKKKKQKLKETEEISQIIEIDEPIKKKKKKKSKDVEVDSQQ